MFKVVTLSSRRYIWYTRQKPVDDIYSTRNLVISEISGNNGLTGVRKVLGTADSENSTHQAGSLLQH